MEKTRSVCVAVPASRTCVCIIRMTTHVSTVPGFPAGQVVLPGLFVEELLEHILQYEDLCLLSQRLQYIFSIGGNV